MVTVNFIQYVKQPKAKIVERFSISRTVDLNNKSKYLINEKTAQFKEVFKKLQDAGVDLEHNRFLILQVYYYLFL